MGYYYNGMTKSLRIRCVVHLLGIRNAYTVLVGKPKEGNIRLDRLHIKMDINLLATEFFFSNFSTPCI